MDRYSSLPSQSHAFQLPHVSECMVFPGCFLPSVQMKDTEYDLILAPKTYLQVKENLRNEGLLTGGMKRETRCTSYSAVAELSENIKT